jgi:glutathione S-transferase
VSVDRLYAVARKEAAMGMRIYGDSISGNCLKVKWTADLMGLSYDWIETSVLDRETQTQAFLEMNPAGQIPNGRARRRSRACPIQRHYFASGGEFAADSG